MIQSKASSEQLIDDDRTRVTRFTFTPGAETGWHQHGYDYVITAITDCDMKLLKPDGSEDHAFITSGDAYRRSAGVHHNVINAGKTKMVFIEIEIK
ncbi:MAG: cupin domain-containing protein [Paracoccaceae bacterium]|nr:cupin domain-containing protein [Paracoccaceae bacterium]